MDEDRPDEDAAQHVRGATALLVRGLRAEDPSWAVLEDELACLPGVTGVVVEPRTPTTAWVCFSAREPLAPPTLGLAISEAGCELVALEAITAPAVDTKV